MTKTVCDRCGKVLCTEKLPKAITEWTVVDIRPRLCAEFTPHFAVYDLCDECRDALVAFIKGEEEEGQPEAVKCDHGPKVRLVSVEHSYRPATEDEVKNGKAAWCHACQSVCINRGKDALVVCDGFTTPFPPEEGADA